MKSNDLNDIVNQFEQWYTNSQFINNIDYYKELFTLEYLSSLKENEFKELFFNFVKNGGFIQNPGYILSRFKITLEENYNNFRDFILKPFNLDFNLKQWFDELKYFKHFGIGIATIYLNQIDKYKYSIHNNLTQAAFKLLGIHFSQINTNNYYKYYLKSNLIEKK